MNEKKLLESLSSQLERHENYIFDLYDIKEELSFKDSKRFYGISISNNLNVIVSLQILPKCLLTYQRLELLVSLIDNNIVLAENIWLENKQVLIDNN